MGMGPSFYIWYSMRKGIINALVGKPTYPSIIRLMKSEGLELGDGKTCPICGFRARTRYGLQIHIVKAHGSYIDSLIRKYYRKRFYK